MKSLLRGLAFFDLVIGTIGSFVLAHHSGRTISDFSLYSSRIYYGRDWALTIAVFIASLFTVLALFAILMSMAEIMETQERLVWRLNESANQTTTKNLDDGWTCPHCGTFNSNKVGTCGCGTRVYPKSELICAKWRK